MNEKTMKILADAAMIRWDGSLEKEIETLADRIASAASSPMASEGGESAGMTEALLLDDPEENGLREDRTKIFPHSVSAASKGYDGTYITVPKVL
jgi:hypothetical protein